MVTADAEEEVGAAKQTSSEHRRQWRTAVRAAAAASERESERGRADGHKWERWERRERPGHLVAD